MRLTVLKKCKIAGRLLFPGYEIDTKHPDGVYSGIDVDSLTEAGILKSVKKPVLPKETTSSKGGRN